MPILIPLGIALVGIVSLVAYKFKKSHRGLPIAQFFHNQALERQVVKDKQRKALGC